MNALNLSTSTIFSNDSNPIVVEAWFIPIGLLTIFCLILTIAFDCLFIWIIIVDKTCHTVTMILIANTCFTQLLAASNALFMSIVTLRNDVQHSQYYDALCLFRGYLSPGASAMIIYSFLLQAIHRYVTVVHPARPFWQSQRIQIRLICASWIFCLLFPLVPLFTGDIIYNINNQSCQIVLSLNLSIILMAICAYLYPVSIIIFLYLRLILYVKAMRNRVTHALTLPRARRELKMMQQTVMLLSILLTLGMPYVIFILISFFTNPPKYHFRIAYTFLEVSFLFLVITLYHFTDPLKTSIKKILRKRLNIVTVAAT